MPQKCQQITDNILPKRLAEISQPKKSLNAWPISFGQIVAKMPNKCPQNNLSQAHMRTNNTTWFWCENQNILLQAAHFISQSDHVHSTLINPPLNGRLRDHLGGNPPPPR